MSLPNPIVEGNVLQIPAIQSVDWVAGGSAGWQIARDGSASFNNLNLFGDIGANDISADIATFNDIVLPNYPSLDVVLDSISQDLSGRVVGFFQQTDAAVVGIGATETRIINLDCFLQPGRIYSIHGMVRVQPSAVNASDQWQALIRGTAGPSAAVPTTSSIVMAQHVGSLWQTAHPESAPFDSGTIPADTPLRLTLTIGRIAGTDTLSSGSSTNSISPDGGTNTYVFRYPGAFLFVLDHGPSYNLPLFVGYNSTDTPPVTPPAPNPRSYTKTYYATWSRTYDGDLTTTWDDSAYCYQGYYSGDRGLTRSLIGFNYAQIQADTAGATIGSCHLHIKGAHAYYNAGFQCYVGTHIYTAKPSTWNGANCIIRRTSVSGLAAGESVDVNLGPTIAGELQSGASKGIAIGPPATTSLSYYGFIYGATQSGKPYITIGYTK